MNELPHATNAPTDELIARAARTLADSRLVLLELVKTCAQSEQDRAAARRLVAESRASRKWWARGHETKQD